ncbi:MAG TPA: tRNA (N6-threonylcarbamoyladenosine(37)-N6)-methyltransferase TrmO [Deltaproteobacteria bacterium]|nr:tRNA (N6-threonylcarbamoyladenosine(37)-N6)-methyltransferase TrmO [Deltaproteobacteria bacterium]
MNITLTPIGILHCPIQEPKDAPNFYSVSDISGTIEIYEPFIQGLDGLEEYEYIVALFHFHRSQGYELLQKRKGTGPLKGVFSLCSPNRPNPIGMSILKLTGIEQGLLTVEHVDMVDGTPIIDIKPYKPQENP